MLLIFVFSPTLITVSHFSHTRNIHASSASVVVSCFLLNAELFCFFFFSIPARWHDSCEKERCIVCINHRSYRARDICKLGTTWSREIVKIDLTFILISHTSRTLVQLAIFFFFLNYITFTIMLTNLVEEGSHVMRPLRYRFRLENIAIRFSFKFFRVSIVFRIINSFRSETIVKSLRTNRIKYRTCTMNIEWHSINASNAFN